MGEAAFLCEAGGELDIAVQNRIWAMAEAVAAWRHVVEVVPGVNNLLVAFDPFAPEAKDMEGDLASAWFDGGVVRQRAGRLVEIPVVYGGASGEDLDEVAAYAGLSREDYVRRHSGGEYRVAAIGSVPGFPYLIGLDPALGRPRRDVPRTRVEAGSVTIGGVQAGILPITSPSGWHILGRTSKLLFNPGADQPALLSPGDCVRFVVESLQA